MKREKTIENLLELAELTQQVQTKLNQISINLKKLSEHIAYDTEENCERDHRGNWAKRLG